MANSLSAVGLTVDSQTEIVDALTLAMQEIYGSDINVDPNSPDGQLINIYAQVASDILELLVDVYETFSVTGAYGTILDQRVAINGITRREGTYTTTPVLVTVNQAITLYGLDQTVNDPFTVSDNAGNQFILATTHVFSASGFASLIFRAADIGLVEVTANSITNQVTTVLGVVSINNPLISILTTGNTTISNPVITTIPTTTNMAPGMTVTGTGIPAGAKILTVDSATQITMDVDATASGSAVSITVATAAVVNGVNEETDAQLRVRQTQSFALAATGPADAVEAALAAEPDVTDAYVLENVEDIEVNTIPAHSIWCIVTGGTDADIAQAIYAKKGIGCNMKGSSSYVIARPNGTSFTAMWDASLTQPLDIEFTINPRTPGVSFDTALLADGLAAALVYLLGQSPTVGDVVNAMLTLAPNAYLTAIGVSKNGSDFFDVVAPDTAQYYFTVATANITINT